MRGFASDLFSGVTAVALLAGAVAVQALPALPSPWVTLALACAGISILFATRRWRWLGFVLVGAAWTIWRADIALAQRLPVALEGGDFIVTGAIHGLPRVQDGSTRFDLAIEDIRGSEAPPLRGTLRVSWYDDAPALQPCERWQLHLRLKRPRGLVDPGAFDFERYALEEGIVATGYVRDDAANRVVGERFLCVDRLRARVSEGIAETLGPGPTSDLLRALAFGDQQAMNEHEWAVARATGIPHLIAISGLHIALFAGFGVLLVRAFWKLVPRLTLRWPAPQIEAVASVMCALAYGTIAGLGLPTRRALVMIGVLLAANLARRSRSSTHGLAFAVIVLLAIDPACVLSAGFWLSFVGVAWLMFCLGNRGGPRHGWRELVRAQGVASIGLLPLSIWFFGQSSLVGPRRESRRGAGDLLLHPAGHRDRRIASARPTGVRRATAASGRICACRRCGGCSNAWRPGRAHFGIFPRRVPCRSRSRCSVRSGCSRRVACRCARSGCCCFCRCWFPPARRSPMASSKC